MKNLFQITVLTLLIVMTSCSTNTFSKRKYRKGVFKEYTMRSHEKSIHSDTLFISQQGQLSERASNYLRIDVEDSLVNIASDSNKIKYIEFRNRMNIRMTRISKKRLHKRWIRDSLLKTNGFIELSIAERKKITNKQYEIERNNEIQFIQKSKIKFKESNRQTKDSLRKANPNISNKKLRRLHKRILKIELDKVQNKYMKSSKAIGIATFPIMGISIFGAMYIALTEYYLALIGVGAILLCWFIVNLIRFLKTKKEYKQIANPSTEIVLAYRRALRKSFWGMIFSLLGIIISGILVGLFFWINNSF